MKTSMLGNTQRRALVAEWPLAIARGVPDGSGTVLAPGDLVRLPASVRREGGPDMQVPGTVLGFAVGKDGVPSVVIDAPAWGGSRMDAWRSWIVKGGLCARIDEADLSAVVAGAEQALGAPVPVADAATRERVSQGWVPLVARGVRTKGGVAIQPGDLVRLPRNVARNRGSQLHAAGLAMGFAVGLDGSPCVVADAVGEDAPAPMRWRTWVVRGRELLVIDTKEAWRLEGMYGRDGRLKPRGSRQR